MFKKNKCYTRQTSSIVILPTDGYFLRMNEYFQSLMRYSKMLFLNTLSSQKKVLNNFDNDTRP